MSISAVEGGHNWHPLNVSDAHFMGRLVVAGVALPNAPGLSQPSLEVPDPTIREVQHEIDRLVATAENIARIPGATFAGLHHAQLAPTEAIRTPLDLMLVPTNVHGAPVETTIRDMGFQCLVNAKISVLHSASGRGTTLTKEGCFSSGPVSVVTRRPDTVTDLEARTRHGELVTALGVTGFSAIVLQHEGDHGRGRRAADTAHVRNWVPRDELEAYRTIKADDAGNWSKHCTPEQWAALSRDPEYAFFSTEELREAFAAGQEAQRGLQQQ
jgi:peptide deformylase